MTGTERLSMEGVATATDPAALFELAWAMEPALRLTERYAALDRLEALLASGDAPPAPAGRDWALELLAERAIDAAAYVRLADAQARARAISAVGSAWLSTRSASAWASASRT